MKSPLVYLLLGCASLCYSSLVGAVPTRPLVVESKIRVGANPVDLVWHPDGKGLFVSLQGYGVLLELRHRKVVRRAQIGSGLSGLALTRDGRTLYATVANTDELVRIDTKTLVVKERVKTCPHPYGIKLSPDGRFLAVACYGSGELLLASTGELRSQRRIRVCRNPYHPEITAQMTRIYLTCYGTNELALISLETRTKHGKLLASEMFPRLLRRVPVGQSPQGISFAPDGKRILVANSTSSDVSLLDLAGRTLRRIKVGSTPYLARFSPSGDRLLVTNRYGNSISIFGPGNEHRVLPVERGALIARFSPNGRTLAVVHFDTCWLSFIE